MEIIMDHMMNTSVVYGGTPLMIGMVDGETIMAEASTESGVKDPLLSSWPFVIGVSAATLAVSIVLGILLAKLKIKKGFELYED